MQIVIDIPEKDYKDIKNGEGRTTYTIVNTLNAVAKGIVLPKGHGRLIDADKLFSWHTGSRTKYPVTEDHSAYNTIMMYEVFDEVDDAPTVLEADKEVE